MRTVGTRWALLALLAIATTLACGNEDDTKEGGGGAASSGGTRSGGSGPGGTTSGGGGTGGTSSGGVEQGGDTTDEPGAGGTDGGAGDAGSTTGGAEDGGDGPGGTSTGGVEEGGEGPGGTATGGTDEGGAGATSTGGSETGGSETGGSGTGGSETGGSETGGSETGGSETGGSETGGSETGGSGTGGTDPDQGPEAGNPDGTCDVPAEAALEDVSSPDEVIGEGTPESCTSARVVAAVAAGGVITFDCGPDPVTIVMDETAVVSNDSERVVIDGGGLVTLSGGGVRRILYQNTCDRVVGWTTPRCDNQATPELTVQNLTFVDGNAKWSPEPGPAGTPAGNGVYAEYLELEDVDVYAEEGGGAIYAQGGRLKIVNSRFFNNVCADEGPDIGGAAVRVMQQYEGLPVYVVNSTFGGAAGYGNTGSNGGAVSSIGVSWTILNSVMSYNAAIGYRGNPADEGTPGGGSGGAIYNDGNTMTLSICGTLIEQNTARAYGTAIFFVSNDHTGNVVIDRSVITNNTGTDGAWEPTYPQISNHEDTPIEVTDSIIEQ